MSRAGPVDILRGVDFKANRGEAVGIVGPSGSGKTTLLMVLGGLERATSGEVLVNGFDLSRKSEDRAGRFRRDTSASSFSPSILIPTMTALENVAVPLEFKGAARALPSRRGKLNGSASAIV